MEFVAAQFINGIATGGIYALLVLGFNVLILVGGVFQFAYPYIVVLSMYIGWIVMRAMGGNIAFGILAIIGSGVGLNLLTEPLFRPLVRRGAKIATFIVSLGIAIICTDLMVRQIHGGVPIGFPIELSGREALVSFGVATLSRGQLATIVGSFTALGVFMYLLYQTKLGRSFRSVAQNPLAARIFGIPILRMSIYSFTLAGLLAGVSATFLAMTLGGASAFLGANLAIKVFAVAIFAGVGNLKGGLICALILGLVESFVTGSVPGLWTNAVAFSMILVVIIVKPQGLFGAQA